MDGGPRPHCGGSGIGPLQWYGPSVVFPGEWRNGRRAGFRCQCPSGRGGSSPPSPTLSGSTKGHGLERGRDLRAVRGSAARACARPPVIVGDGCRAGGAGLRVRCAPRPSAATARRSPGSGRRRCGPSPRRQPGQHIAEQQCGVGELASHGAGFLLVVSVMNGAVLAAHRDAVGPIRPPRREHPLALHQQYVPQVATVLERRPDTITWPRANVNCVVAQDRDDLGHSRADVIAGGCGLPQVVSETAFPARIGHQHMMADRVAGRPSAVSSRPLPKWLAPWASHAGLGTSWFWFGLGLGDGRRAESWLAVTHTTPVC